MSMLIDTLTPKQKSSLLCGLDTVSSCVALLLAIYLKLPFPEANQFVASHLVAFPIFVGVKLITYRINGLYRFLWRYASVKELFTGFRAITTSSVILFGIVLLVENARFPLSILIIDWMLNIIFIGGSRVLLRAYRDKCRANNAAAPTEATNKPKCKKNLLIVGAGDAGEMIAREILKSDTSYKLIGFVDDTTYKVGQQIHQMPVLGTSNDIPKLVGQYGIDEAILAIPSATGDKVREITEKCAQAKIITKTTPGLSEIIEGKVSISQLRNIQIDDLLGRDIVQTNMAQSRSYIDGNTVLVTGAGGSIGSELCRQIQRLSPKKLILVDHSENNIYRTDHELRTHNPSDLPIETCVADVKNRPLMDMIFTTHKPDVVFHAAAYKHVPLMEDNIGVAIQNNIMGTQNVIELSDIHKISRCVIISTDKAVDPVNTMGATKRVGEMLMQMQQSTHTKYSAVRFGNVLGSDGSVVPLFKKQIESGGPITVTHEDMTRFFMTITEAVRLVMEAGSLSDGGEIFVLDMGNPVKIMNLAKDMIRLSGLTEGRDISIKITGLRPGEKLEEALFYDEEHLKKTSYNKIFVAQPRSYDREILIEKITRLISDSTAIDTSSLREQLLQITASATTSTTNETQKEPALV